MVGSDNSIFKDSIRNAENAEKKMELSANTYLNGIINYVKWTSTIAMAALIWFGSNLTNIKGTTNILTIIGIISLLISLILAIFIVKKVLDASALKFAHARDSFYIWRSIWATDKSESSKQSNDEIIQSIGENIDRVAIGRIGKTLDDMQLFSIPNGFNSYVIWHVVFIVIGLLLYVIAQLN